MNAKHTPGPWSGGKEIPIRAHNCEAIGFSICFVSSDRDGETAANARLIAAAPELLAALVSLARDELLDDDDPQLIATRRQADAAIAKATGAA